jgi:hypothetical protein
MGIYRIRLRNQADALTSDREYLCRDDREALALAERMRLRAKRAEVWDRERPVEANVVAAAGAK